MAVETETTFSGPFSANGVTTAFPFSFVALAAEEIAVVARGADGNETVVDPAGYGVTFAEPGPGGTVTFAAAPPAGLSIFIISQPAFTQEISFENGSRWLADPVNEANDRAALRDLWLKERADRALQLPRGETAPPLPSLAALEGGKTITVVDGQFVPAVNDAAGSTAERILAQQARQAAEAAAGEAAADAEQTAADRVQTGIDRVAAGNEADRAELAADAAAVSGHLYPDEATGRAAVSDGDYFLVVGDGTSTYALLYQRVNSGTSTLISAYPSKEALDAALATLTSAGIDFARLPLAFDVMIDGYKTLVRHSSTTYTAVTGNRSDVLCASVDVGVDVQAGQIVDRIGLSLSAGAAADGVKLDIYKLPTADPGIDTPATIIATTPISELTSTAAALGIPVGANPPPSEIMFTLDDPFQTEPAMSYFARVRITDGSSDKVATGYSYRTVGANSPHERGWARTTVSDTWTAESNTRRIIVNVYTKNIISTAELRQDVDDLQEKTAQLANTSVKTLAEFSFSHMALYNQQSALMQQVINPITPPNGTICVGDSNTAGNPGGDLNAPSYTEMLPDFLSGPIVKRGWGGATSSQILANFQALSSGEKAMSAVFMFGTNAGNYCLTLLSDFQGCIDALSHGNYVLVSAIQAVGAPYTWRPFQMRNDRQALETFGNRVILLSRILQLHTLEMGPRIPKALGATGTEVFTDDKHLNKAGAILLAEHVGRALRAISGGAPYIHHDLFAWHSGMSVGTSIGTPRFLGTCEDWQIIAGNADDLVRINSRTGEITKGIGTETPEIRNLLVRGRGPAGTGPGMVACITLVRAAETDQPIYPVRMHPLNLAGLYGALQRRKAADESHALVPDATSFSLVVRHKFDDDTAGGHLFAGQQGFCSRAAGGRLRYQVPSAVSGLLHDFSNPLPLDPLGINWHFMSYDATTGTARSAVASGGSVASATTSGSTGTIRTSTLDGLFCNTDGGNAPFLGENYLVWFAAGTAIDWTSSTERERFYDPSTFEPQAIPGDGEVNGVTPDVYVRGRSGDRYTMANKGSAAQLYAPPPLAPGDMLFGDAAP